MQVRLHPPSPRTGEERKLIKSPECCQVLTNGGRLCSELWPGPKAEGILVTQSLRLPHTSRPSSCFCLVLNIIGAGRGATVQEPLGTGLLKEPQGQPVQAAPE